MEYISILLIAMAVYPFALALNEYFFSVVMPYINRRPIEALHTKAIVQYLLFSMAASIGFLLIWSGFEELLPYFLVASAILVYIYQGFQARAILFKISKMTSNKKLNN